MSGYHKDLKRYCQKCGEDLKENEFLAEHKCNIMKKFKRDVALYGVQLGVIMQVSE